VDANRGWSVPDAVRFAHLVEHLDIRWFEEPCHWCSSTGDVRACTGGGRAAAAPHSQ
jgi:D-arabinonate dehydratase